MTRSRGACHFTGESITFQAVTDPGGGEVDVLVDGVLQGRISLFSPTTVVRTWTLGNLAPGGHVLHLRAYRGATRFDSVTTPGTGPVHTWPTPSGVIRYEEDHPAIRYDGQPLMTSAARWNLFAGGRMSGGHGVWVEQAGSTIQLTVPGSWVHIGFLTTTSGALVEARINGVSRGTIDTYSRTEDLTSVVYRDLGPGPHTLSLTLLARPGGTLGGNRLHLDYIDVWDGASMPPSVREHDHHTVFRSSNWTFQSLGAASDGSYLRDGSNVWAPFTGEAITFQAIADGGGGEAEVLIDGSLQGRISLWNATPITRTWTFAAPDAGPHVLQLRAYRGNARVDRFVTPGVAPLHSWPNPSGVIRLEEDAASLRYNSLPLAQTSSAWNVFTNARLSGQYGTWTGTAGASISVPVPGSWVNLGFLGNTNGGTVEVRVNGALRGTIDTNRASEQPVNVVYSDLGQGPHTVTLTLLGTPSGRRLHLDYVDVWDGTPLPAGVFEHDSPRLFASGGWSRVSEGATSGGAYTSGGHSIWFPFAGGSVTYQAWTTGGTVQLLVNGVLQETATLQNSPAALRAWSLRNLGPGPHILELRASAGTASLDHFVTPAHTAGAPPTGVRQLAATDTTVTVGWNAAVAATSIAAYDVFVGGVPAGTTTGTSFVVPNLLTGTSYDITVRARDTQGGLSPTSSPLSVTTSGPELGVVLVASLSPTTATTDERIVDLVVEARDRNGNLVPGYRGAIDITTSSPVTGLTIGDGVEYTFTAADAGRRVFQDFAFSLGGPQSVTVSDRFTPGLSTTSNAVAVQAIRLVVTVSPTTIFAGDPTVVVTLEVQDDAGNRLTGYRGGVRFSSTTTFSGLPRTGLGGSPYWFTEADAGRKVWTDVVFNTAGTHTLWVGDGIRGGTSQSFSVQPVSLALTVTPMTVFASEPVVSVTVEAQDMNGNRVAGYRGGVRFSSTSTFSGLPRTGLGGIPYWFTAEDAGRKTFTGVSFGTAGSHTLTVGDGTRSTTSAPITIQAVSLVLSVTPTTVFAGEPVVEVTVEARDQNGNLVPGYRGGVQFSSTSTFSGLPRTGLGGIPYWFTEADAGRKTFTGVTLNTAGTHTLTVGDGTRSATSVPTTVQAVSLVLSVTPTTVFAGEPVVEVTVEARDQNGALVPGYRGGVEFSSTSAFSGLPRGGLGGSPYVFTAADAGRKTFTGVMLNTPGSHTISVGDGFRSATSVPLTVQAVTLSVSVATPSPFVCDPTIAVTVEARDQNGNLVPGYRGGVTFSSTGAVNGLPRGGLGGSPYVFTEADAGRKTFTSVMVTTAGTHTISVGDGFRSATSAPFTIQPVTLRATLTGSPLYLKIPSLTLAIEVVDNTGQRVPGYRCGIDLNPTGPTVGVPQTTFQSTPDYTFTETDAGRVVFPSVAFLATGEHTITVVDRGDGSRQATPPALAITLPPDPTPIAAGSRPAGFVVPPTLSTVPGRPHSFAEPFMASLPEIGLNGWEGHPPTRRLATPGTLQMISGVSQRVGWWAGTHYACVYGGWENPVTDQRLTGGGVSDLPYQDPTFFAGGTRGCGGWSTLSNNGDTMRFGPWFPDDEDELAPAGTQGHHANIQGAGNTGGWIVVGVNPLVGEVCSTNPTQGNPIDVLTGFKVQHELDLGIATGCGEVSLAFERTYRQSRLDGGSLGPSWVHNFEQRVIANGELVLVALPRGELMLFTDTGGSVYAGPAGSDVVLTRRASGGWALLHRSQRVDLFDASGRLVAQQDPNGGMLWLTYEDYSRTSASVGTISGSRLARVDAPGGRYLWFGYDYYQPDQLIIVGDHSGRQVRFGYDRVGHEGSGRLSSVTDPLGQTTTYTYQDATPWLVSKTNARGEVVFTNTFDSSGRVTRQVNSQGQELSFTYQTVSDNEGLMVGTGLAPYLLRRTVTDQTGGTVAYLFGADGLLRRMTDPAGATTEFRGYTAAAEPTEIVDGLGRITRITRDARGLPLTITNALNQTTTFTYDSWGRPTSMIDALGRTTTVSYTGGQVAQVTNALGQSVTMTYSATTDWPQLLTAVTNQEGRSTAFAYNAAGDLTTITDALGQVTQLGYDALGRPTSITNARGATTQLAYDAADRITRITDALGGTVQVTYDAVGNPVRLTDQAGHTTILTYTLELRDRPVAMQDARGGVVRIGYGAHGRPITVTDQLGNQTITSYDRAGRPAAIRNPLGNITRFGYDQLGNTTVITDANGHATTIRYDALNRPIEVRNGAGQRIQYGYDAVGNVAVITDTLGANASVVYDALNRPLLVTDQEGRATRYAYTPLGQTRAITDGNGIATHYRYDALGQLEQVIANARPGLPDSVDTNVRTRFAYDPAGNLRQVTDPRGFVSTFSYDPLNRLTSLTDPLSRTMRYVYDARGLLTRWEKADGSAISYAYNPLGQLTTLIAPDQTIRYAYDAAGRTTRMEDASGTTTFAYDRASRPLTVTLSLGGSVGYGYDAVGNRTRLVYPDGRTATYSYNGANQVTSISDWSGGTTSFAYDGNGRLITRTLPSGVSSVHSYDHSGLPTRIRHANGATVLADDRYTYDATGRRVGALEAGRTITYTYDGLYRLLNAQDSAGDSFAYSYDAAGNRLSKVEPGESQTATYDAANQLLTLNGLPVQYDANGNLLNDGVQSYAYDSLDRLVRVTRGITTTTFGYNGEGDRLWQEVNGSRTSFTLDLNTALTQVLAQSGGGATTYLLPGVGQQVNGAWQYSHSDPLGSVRLLTDPAGQVLASMRYSPFGEEEAQSGPSSVFGFTGEPSDPSGDLLYLRARFYHPGMGRFLTPDSLIPDPLNGQAWNRYAYVYNDPVNYTDPSGHIPVAFVLRALAFTFGPSLVFGAADLLMPFNPEWDRKWRGQSCDCEAGSDSGGSWKPVVDYGVGALTGFFGGLPATVTVKQTHEQRTMNFAFERSADGKGWDVVRGGEVPRSQELRQSLPPTQWSDFNTTKESTITVRPRLHSTTPSGGVRNQIEAPGGPVTARVVTNVTQTLQPGAIIGGGVLGGLLGASSSAAFDYFGSCLSYREIAQRAATEWAYGAALGLGSGGVAAHFVRRNMSPLRGLLASTGFGAAGEFGVDFLRDITPLP